MRFSEALIPRYTGLELSDAYGKIIGTGNLALDPKDNTKLIAPITSRLKAGNYTVAWHAVSIDTHRLSGVFSFKVQH